MTGRWKWMDDGHYWAWVEDRGMEVMSERVLAPANDPRPLTGDYREHQTKAGPLWVPEGARLHAVPFGFRAGAAQ